LQLDRKDLAIPACDLGKLVVREDVGALVCFTQMREPHGWHNRHSDQLCGLGAAMSRNDLLVVIDQDRIVEPEPLDTPCDLLNLPFRMGPRVTRLGPERTQGQRLNLHHLASSFYLSVRLDAIATLVALPKFNFDCWDSHAA
jgi:hypothetical protein